MPRLSRQQRDKVAQVAQVAGSGDAAALRALEAAGWSVEGAFDVIFASQAAAPRVDTEELERLFDKYKAEHEPTKILAEGVGALCEDLEVDPSDIAVLVMAHDMGAKTMCEFTRDEFVGGLAAMGVANLAALKERLPDMRTSLQRQAVFRKGMGARTM